MWLLVLCLRPTAPCPPQRQPPGIARSHRYSGYMLSRLRGILAEDPKRPFQLLMWIVDLSPSSLTSTNDTTNSPMAATQEYESIAMDADDVDDDDDIDEDKDDIEESPRKKLSPPKKRPPKKRRAPPEGGGCCRSFCSFFCAFLLALIVVLGLLGGAYYVLTLKGYRFSATQSDDNAGSDSLWLGHGWHRPKSLDSQEAITGDSSGDTSINSNTISRGHNTEGQQPPAEIPQPEPVPVVHKPSHISVTNTVPGVNVVAEQKPGSTETKQSDPIAVETASPTTPPESSPTDEEKPTGDQSPSTEDKPEPAQPSVEDAPEPDATPEEQSQEETTPSDASDDDVLSKFRSKPP